MHFEILGKIENIEVISKGRGIRDLKRLNKMYGKGKVEKTERYCDTKTKKW